MREAEKKMSEEITLGLLTFDGEPYDDGMRVFTRASYDSDVVWLTTAEWQSLVDLATLQHDLTAARAEVERLTAAHDFEERIATEALEERDACIEQINHIADALGDEGEWSNLHDRGDAALYLARNAVAEAESLRAEVERLRKAAPVMLTVMAWLADEASTNDLRDIALWHANADSERLETWLDAERAKTPARAERESK